MSVSFERIPAPRYLDGEYTLQSFDWHTMRDLAPAVAFATTHRILVYGEHRPDRDPYWSTLYDFAKLGPAKSFAIHEGDWYLDLGRMVIRNQRPYSHWEEV